VPAVDWVEAIGYQHEVLHTGAVAHLLRGERAPSVIAGLLGVSDVAAVEDVRPEVRLNGARPVDLAAVVVARDGTRTWLGVELKVDSAWTPKQLRESVPDDCHGVLLAVGYTALAATQRDLDALRAAADENSGRPLWRLVRPREWGAIVRDHAPGDPELERYARCVLEEAGEHADALEAIAAGRPTTASPDRDAQVLGHWAYFHEVICDRDDVAEWGRKTLISGPLLTLWVIDHDEDRGDYLEFMGHSDGSRSLNVKTYAPAGTGALAESRARLRRLFADHRPDDVKQPGVNAKTCTPARWWLDDLSPRDASALADELQERLGAQPAP
jgi:hypothetical protein